MDSVPTDRPIKEWNESTVAAWVASLGFPQYEQQFKDHGIAGIVLCHLDLDYLKEIGISSIGQRLAILKAVYYAKLACNEPVEPGDYIPPSEAEEKQDLTLERLHNIVKEQTDRLRVIEQENKKLQDRLQVCFEELGTLHARFSDDDRGLRKQPSMRWAPIGKSARSPTKPVPDGVLNESPHASPSKAEHDIPSHPPRPPREHIWSERPSAPPRTGSSASTSTAIGSPNGSGPQSRSSPANSRGEVSSADGLKSFKLSLEDPTWKILPAALKKYKIKDEDWRNYVMFICYGNIDRCLSYDEKPLVLFQTLKDAKRNPVFMLKHIKDIRSPIAQAQQKQQVRNNTGLGNQNGKDSNAATPAANSGRSLGGNYPSVRSATSGSRQQLHAPPISTTGSSASQSQWPEAMSPIVENKGHDDLLVPIKELSDLKKSYAIAIYPYVADHDDEFDVALGDTFVILSRAKGWWVVQRDIAGNGRVELDGHKQAWVPAGCLLETSVPVASTDPSISPSRVSIPPSNIVSTGYAALALMDYRKRADEELDLYAEEVLRVFKRYNHWSYVVKEENGERGWVPSWFLSKIGANAGAPQTPSAAHAGVSVASAPITFASGDGGNGVNQISPLTHTFSFPGRSAPGL